jgi:hypothetical protein
VLHARRGFVALIAKTEPIVVLFLFVRNKSTMRSKCDSVSEELESSGSACVRGSRAINPVYRPIGANHRILSTENQLPHSNARLRAV